MRHVLTSPLVPVKLTPRFGSEQQFVYNQPVITHSGWPSPSWRTNVARLWESLIRSNDINDWFGSTAFLVSANLNSLPTLEDLS